MDILERELKAHLTRLSDTADASGEQRVLRVVGSGMPTESPRSRPLLPVLGGLVAAVSLVAGLNLAGVLGGDSSQPDGDDDTSAIAGQATNGMAGVVAPGEPCSGARHGDPLELAARADVPLWLPEGAEATDGWTCAGSTPVVMFGDIQVSYESGWAGVDVQEKWSALSRDYGGEVVEIQGRPAYVAASSETVPNDEVLIVARGTLIRLLAPGSTPVSKLVALAEAIDVGHPLGG